MFEKFKKFREEFKELEKKLTLPEVIKDNNRFSKYARRYNELKEPLEKYKNYLKFKDQFEQARTLYDQEEGAMKELAKDEMDSLSVNMEDLKRELKGYLMPEDPDIGKDIIMELRAGTGGDEASLFCAELFRMYSMYADRKKWRIDIYNSNRTGLGGIKEIVFSIEGKNVYENLKWESGVHRVQRVPETETSGRIHTSACSVVVLPQADPIEVEIDKEDLRIDTYRSSGAGGQHVNVTDSAVRITHLPTGIVVQCQDERSQMQNRRKAMNILRARLKEKLKLDQAQEEDEKRRKQIGTGDRSEKIRTYNFPQNRVTDHRIGLTIHNLDFIIDGNLNNFLKELRQRLREKQIDEN